MMGVRSVCNLQVYQMRENTAAHAYSSWRLLASRYYAHNRQLTRLFFLDTT